MSRDASGNYVLPPVINPVVPNTVIATTWANPTLQDIATALNDSLSRSGQGGMTANLAMGGFGITGLAPTTSPTGAPTAKQVRDIAFSWLTGVASDASGNAITGNAVLGAEPLAVGTMYIFMPDKANLGPVSLNVSGVGAVPITTNGGALPGGTMFVGRVVTVVFNGTSYAMTSGGGGSGVNTLNTSDPALITVSQPTVTNYLLTTNSNVASGMVKLTLGTKVPVNLLPADGLTMLGMWDAFPGVLPAAGTIAGQYYIVTKAGTLTLYVTNGAGGWTATPTAVVAGDMLLWNAIAPEPVGWYHVPKANVTTATSVVLTPTPSFPGANTVQAWVDAADSVSGFALANGTRPFTGRIIAPQVTGIDFVTGGMYTDGLNWRFATAGGWGWLRVVEPAGGYSDYLSTAASTGVGSIASISQRLFLSPASFTSLGPLGVGVVPRAPGGSPLSLDVQTNGLGLTAALFTELANQIGVKFLIHPSGVYIDNFRFDVNGNSAVLGGIPTVFRNQDAAGTIFTSLTINPTRLVQVGDNAAASPGAIASTWKNLGAYAGALNFANYQTAFVNPGSTITAISMYPGQVGRIEIGGGGAITLPAGIRLSRGGAVFGTFATIISLYFDSGTTFATFTPFDV